MSEFEIEGVPLAEAAGTELTAEQVDAFMLSLKYQTSEGSTFKEDILELVDDGLKLGGILGSRPGYAHMLIFFNDIVTSMNYTPLHKAFQKKKFEVAKFYIEAGHKLNSYTDSGETPLDTLISECTDTAFFDLYLEKGGCSLTEAPGYVGGTTPVGVFMGGSPPPNIPPLFTALQCCNLIYTKHIVGLMKAAGLPINKAMEFPGMGEKTALQFSQFFLEVALPQMTQDPRCPPDLEENCKAIVEFLIEAEAGAEVERCDSSSSSSFATTAATTTTTTTATATATPIPMCENGHVMTALPAGSKPDAYGDEDEDDDELYQKCDKCGEVDLHTNGLVNFTCSECDYDLCNKCAATV
jgi:hypothetical protein